MGPTFVSHSPATPTAKHALVQTPTSVRPAAQEDTKIIPAVLHAQQIVALAKVLPFV
jgi:hypothetical protein